MIIFTNQPKHIISLIVIILTMTTVTSPGQHHQHGNKANQYMHQHSYQELTRRFDDPARDLWQKPEQVIDLLGEIKGRTILDIGAGTGYFAFKIAERGALVVAADVDDNFQNFITSKKKELGYGDDQIVLKKIPYDSPELSPSSIDLAIIVNTYHHIEDRIPYFQEVLQGLVNGGMLMVVDFKKQQFDQETPGPPYDMRISLEEVVQELKQSGFKEFSENTDLLSYQYILMAHK